MIQLLLYINNKIKSLITRDFSGVLHKKFYDLVTIFFHDLFTSLMEKCKYSENVNYIPLKI